MRGTLGGGGTGPILGKSEGYAKSVGGVRLGGYANDTGVRLGGYALNFRGTEKASGGTQSHLGTAPQTAQKTERRPNDWENRILSMDTGFDNSKR